VGDFQPNAKEFFEKYSSLVTKKKMTIKEFEKEQANLLKDADVRRMAGIFKRLPACERLF
jgi:hypothetical protein